MGDSVGINDVRISSMTGVILATAWHRIRTSTTSDLVSPDNQVYRSLDGGDTWGYPAPGARASVAALASTSRKGALSSTLWARICNSATVSLGRRRGELVAHGVGRGDA